MPSPVLRMPALRLASAPVAQRQAWRRVRCSGQHGAVTTIKINAITVPEGSGDELARRFAARAGAVDGHDGFEGDRKSTRLNSSH